MKPIIHIKYDMVTRFKITERLREQYEKRIEKLQRDKNKKIRG